VPFYLRARDLSTDTAALESVLIVPCRFCPAASFAVREGRPFIEPFHSFLRTPAYESHIRALRSWLENRDVKTDVFDSRLPHQFVMCMWTSARRQALARRAAGYDAVIVLGCDGAVETARSSTRAIGCRVIPGMDVEGVMNVIPSLHSPLNVRLELSGVTPVPSREEEASQAPS